MLFLLDENIPGHTETFLKKAGYSVLRSPRTVKDQAVLSLARQRQAIIVTRDRDFLNFLPTAFSGIIYVQIHPSIAEHITEALRRFLATTPSISLQGSIIILRRDGYELFR